MTRFPKESEPYKKHEKIREMMCHKFARMLLELEEGEELYDPESRKPVRCWRQDHGPQRKVTGSPSKKGRGEAAKWMLERNPNWDGSTKAIRREIAQTFNHSQRKFQAALGSADHTLGGSPKL